MLNDINKHDPCAFLNVMEVVSGKWRGTVLYCLSTGPMRFNTLRNALAPISPKVLTQELRAMQRDGIVERKHFTEIPPRVEYTLTELGESLAEIFDQINKWRPNMDAVTASRKIYDATTEPID